MHTYALFVLTQCAGTNYITKKVQNAAPSAQQKMNRVQSTIIREKLDDNTRKSQVDRKGVSRSTDQVSIISPNIQVYSN